MNTEDTKNLITEFLGKLSIDVDGIEAINNPATQKPRFVIKTKDSKLLIGNRGANLHALNLLVKQIARKKVASEDAAVNFLIDVNNYHGKRIDEVLYQAKITAERVRMFKHDIEMLPMNAYERLLIHSFFSEDTSISTESQGEGKFRKIVLKYCETDAYKASV